MSDRTWNRLGRRRPYFLVGAILASIALFFMPNSSALWMAAGLLWILDASINITMEPFRAFVADKLPEEQRTLGFVMQSFFIGIGQTLANALPYLFTTLGVVGVMATGIPLSVDYAFKIGAVVFLIAVLWTVVSTKEYPPEDMEAFQRMKRETKGHSRGFCGDLFVGGGDAYDDEAARGGPILHLVCFALHVAVFWNCGCASRFSCS